jgi:hypothetical protein
VGLHPTSLQHRFPQAMSSLHQRVTKLETRTSVIDSGFPVATLPAVIDHAYAGTGNPMVYANGAATLTGPYAPLGSYVPKAGDRVVLTPVPSQQTYVITGTTTAQAAVSTAWQQVAMTGGFTGTIQYRFPDQAGLNVQLSGQVTLPSSGAYNDIKWGTIAAAYYPSADRNWPAILMSGTSYGNTTYPGAPHCFVVPGLGLYLWGIPNSLNGDNVDVSGIYAL